MIAKIVRQHRRFTSGAGRKMRLCFIYRTSWLSLGSTYVRAHGLARIAEAQLSDRVEVTLEGLEDGPKADAAWVAQTEEGRVNILTKGVARTMNSSTARALKRKSAALCFDHVDTDLRKMRTAGADFHLCCSYAQFDALERRRKSWRGLSGQPFLLLHNLDPRIGMQRFRKLPEMRAVYCGLRENCFASSDIDGRIDMLPAGTVSEMDSALQRLADYNLHYCVRPPKLDAKKAHVPFTKGFTAAACDSNVIAHPDTPDVTAFLGDDYPYLIKAFTADAVLETLDRAQEDFGGPTWAEGLRRMEEVKNRISDIGIASQLKNLLDEITSG